MHFRLRNHVVQLIRTTYDPASKKPRTEIVGRLDRVNPQIAPELLDSCTPAELEEIRLWIGTEMRAQAVAAEHAARTLAEQMIRAGEWFAATAEFESARPLASQVQQQWVVLRGLLRRRGLLE